MLSILLLLDRTLSKINHSLASSKAANYWLDQYCNCSAWVVCFVLFLFCFFASRAMEFDTIGRDTKCGGNHHATMFRAPSAC